MKRRAFSLGAAAAAVTAVLAVPAVQAQGAAPRAGKDYQVLEQRAPVDAAAGKIEVIEFFGYFCPHCNAFEPAFDAWAKAVPADVVIKRVPVGFSAAQAPQQRLYYTLEAMGQVEAMHRKVFRSIHVDRQALQSDAAIMEWANKQGLDMGRFAEVFKSFGVASKARRAVQLQDAYRVEGVPSLGIAGRYYTDGTLAGTMPRVLQVTDYLIGQTRQGR